MAPRSIPDKTRTLVLKLYEQGVTNREITERTGVGASTIYWILQQAGVKPDRMSKSADHVDNALVAMLVGRIGDLERQLGRLEAEVEFLRRQNRAKRTN